MKRRALLAGIGTASIGVGATFGSGAFTSIEAERDVTLNVKGDSSAQIIFEKGDGGGAGRLIRTDSSNAVDVIEFSQTDLNEQSKTIFKEALNITNNTDDGSGFAVNLYVRGDNLSVQGDDGSDVKILDFIDADEDSSIVGSGNKIELSKSDTEEIDIVVDLRNKNVNDNTNDLNNIKQVTFVVEKV